MNFRTFAGLMVAGLLLTSAALAGPPKSFQRTGAGQWVTFEIREGVDFQHAWNTVFDLLVKDFDLDMSVREEGYLRTGWLHSYAGDYRHEYRVRVTVRFAPDHKTVRLKPEAQVKDGDNWLLGSDSRLIATLKSDLMGTIGRATR